MKVEYGLFLALLAILISGCSKPDGQNSSGASNQKPLENVSVISKVNTQANPSQSVESSNPNPRDVVSFDGKNYIKKNGWKIPPKKDRHKNESYDPGDREEITKSGKKIRTKTYHYFIRPLWLHSEDFIYNGRELDNMRGKLEGSFFLETSANGKVFLYSISVKKVESAPPSNGDHWEPFMYDIMDADGDGIFETLVHQKEDVVVPDWVLKTKNGKNIKK